MRLSLIPALTAAFVFMPFLGCPSDSYCFVHTYPPDYEPLPRPWSTSTVSSTKSDGESGQSQVARSKATKMCAEREWAVARSSQFFAMSGREPS
jgi:hypothetical protein